GFVVNALRGLHLHDLAVHAAHVGGAADHVLILLGAIELHYHLALVNGAAGRRQAHDAQAGNLGSLEDHRARALDIAAHPHRHHEIALADARHGDFDLGGPGVVVRRVHTADAHRE